MSIWLFENTLKTMAVPVQTQPAFSFGQPVPLAIDGILQTTGARRHDAIPDGNRFLMMEEPGTTPSAGGGPLRIYTVLNWIEELKQRVSVK